MTPNWFATVALLSWPLVAVVLYRTYPFNLATLWTILGGQLLLPVGASIKFEMISALDKNSIPSLAAIAGCLLVLRRFPKIISRFRTVEVLILILIFSPFITADLNPDPIALANRILPAETYYDAGSAIISQFLFMLPFFVARRFLRKPADITEIFHVLVIAGLIYSLPMLFEIRMSPQLHTWVYGYFPASFLQQYRDGGFRPVGCLGHGLIVALFAMTTAVAAAAFWRAGIKVFRLASSSITAYLSVILYMCKTLGALLYGAVLVPLVRFTKPTLQMRIAVLLACFALFYPILRIADLLPTTFMVDAAALFSTERADSLKTRFDQEHQLLEHASERLLFGWGRFGRSRIYDEEIGIDVSRTDGRWIITTGQFGLFGFVAEFGLLALSVFRAARALRFTKSPHEDVFLAALALIVAVSMVDQLPNASLSPWTWLLAGSLLGRAEELRASAPSTKNS